MEERVVVLDGRAEQERALPVDQNAQVGKEAGVLVKDAFRMPPREETSP